MNFDVKQLEAPLNKVVASYKLPDDLCRLMNQDNHTRFIKPEWLRKFIYKSNSASLAWLCDLHRINLLNSSSYRRGMSLVDIIRETLRNKSTRTPKLWPWIFLAIYILSCAMLLVNIYFQYIYDTSVAKLNKLQELQSSGRELVFNLTKFKLELEHKINETQRVLLKMGASHFEWSFIIEVIIVIFVQTIVWFVIYPSRHYVFSWTLLSVKAILDEAHETESRVRMIMEEIERFRCESLAFASAHLGRLRQDFKIAFSGTEPTSGGSERVQLIARETEGRMRLRVKKKHATLMSRLESVAKSGRLNPLNRNPLGRDQLVLSSFLCSIGFTIYAINLLGQVYLSVKSYLESFNKRVQHRNFADIIYSADLLVFIWASFQSAGFVATLLVCNITDDLNLNKRLRALILGIMRANEVRFEAIKQASTSLALKGLSIRHKSWPQRMLSRQETRPQFTSQCTRLAQETEIDLITIIIQYRLTSEHATSIRDSIQWVVHMLIGWSFFVPAILMIHGVYMCADIHIRLVLLSFGCSFTGLFFLAPLAHLYRHRLALFQTLWSLVAQLSYYETMPEVSSQLDLDGSVSLLSLKRLLSKSSSLSDNLAFKMLRMPVTNMNLARFFSYILIVTMVGSVLTTRLLGEGVASFMRDPLRLYDFSDEIRVKESVESNR